MAFVDSFSHPRPAVPRARPRRQQVENLPYVRGAGIIGTWQHNPADDRITAGWLRSMGVPSVRVFCADHNCSHSVSVGTPHAVGWHEIPGFSDADPWLPLAKHSREENVESLRRDNGSLLALPSAIEFRCKHAALAEGWYRPLVASGNLLLFCRELGNERMLIALNIGAEPLAVTFNENEISEQVILSSFADREGEELRYRLAGR